MTGAPFGSLRSVVVAAFGARLPVDSFPRYVPHLSIARNVRSDALDVLVAIDAALAGGAIASNCGEVVLLERESGPWQVRARWPLGWAPMRGAQSLPL